MLKRKLLILSFLPHFCFAMSVTDFFYNTDQQGYNLLKQNKNASAAAKFTDKNWKGVAYYRDNQYESAYDKFKLDNSAEGLYNQGNALAHLEKYDDAISAYTKALELKKDYPDAKFNKELLEKLKQQQQNSDKNDKQKDKSDKDDKSDSKSDKNDKSDNKSDKNNKSDDKSDKNDKSSNSDKSNKDASKNSKDTSQDTKNGSKDNKKQPEPAKEQNTKSQEEQAAKKAAEDSKAEQAAKADNKSHQTPTQIENAEVKSALSQVPDDPGGLLRNKFIRDYQSGQDND